MLLPPPPSRIDRGIEFDEFQQKIRDIDRSESRTGSYLLTDSGELRLDPTPDELPDWDDDRRAMHAQHVHVCTERGGVIIGAFDLQQSGHQVMIGATVLDGEWIGEANDTLDMYFLFASRRLKQQYVDAGAEPADYRDAGIGGWLPSLCTASSAGRCQPISAHTATLLQWRTIPVVSYEIECVHAGSTLIEKAMAEARARGAKNMYISAANSQHTIDFYLRKGAVLATEPQDIPNSGFAGTQDIQLVRPLF
jgi:hypothetical protein